MNGVEARTFRMLIETMGHGRSETRRGGDPGCGISEAGVRGGERQGTHGTVSTAIVRDWLPSPVARMARLHSWGVT
jgi:hypothetical protein